MSLAPVLIIAVAVALIPAGAIIFFWYGLLHFVSARWPAKAAVSRPPKTYDCSFCGKSYAEVRKLIAGPNVNICDKCVLVCNNLLDSEPKKELLT
jgi:hypothetical protein